MTWFDRVQAALAPFDTDERFSLMVSRAFDTFGPGGCHIGWYAVTPEGVEYGNAPVRLPAGHQAIWGSLADQVKADYERSVAAGTPTTVRAAYP